MSQASATLSARDVEVAARPRRKTRVLRTALMVGGIAVVAAGSLAAWLMGGRYAYTDDAYVEAALLPVATDVSGLVGEVAVHEGEHVTKGQVLFRLDPSQFTIALDGARANLAETALTMEAMKRDYRRMLHDIDAKAAQVADDQANLGRFANLVKAGGVTRAEYDDARFKLSADQQALESLRAQAEAQLARLSGNPAIDVTRR